MIIWIIWEICVFTYPWIMCLLFVVSGVSTKYSLKNKSNKEFKLNYSLNPKIHKNLSTKFLNYGNEEDLEKMLLESQKSKF